MPLDVTDGKSILMPSGNKPLPEPSSAWPSSIMLYINSRETELIDIAYILPNMFIHKNIAQPSFQWCNSKEKHFAIWHQMFVSILDLKKRLWP